MIELFVLLGLVALAGGDSSPPVLVAEPWKGTGGGGGAQPPPPMQNGQFRTGAMPDPAAPNDPDRGRYFDHFGQAKYEGHEAVHEAPIVQLAANANGVVKVTVWASRAGKPERCTRWGSSIVVKDGRVEYPGGWSLAEKCGAQHVTWTDPGGCVLKLPVLRWEQRGSTLFLLWSTKVEGKASESDGDCDEHLGFYVDVFWRFE